MSKSGSAADSSLKISGSTPRRRRHLFHAFSRSFTFSFLLSPGAAIAAALPLPPLSGLPQNRLLPDFQPCFLLIPRPFFSLFPFSFPLRYNPAVWSST
jgi:hypothetical protein